MGRILVAEDDDAVRTFVTHGLEQDGHQVASAGDGAAALDRLLAAEPGFDLLLADIRMPVMDGIALALAAKRDLPDLKIVLMTGYADQRERAIGLDAIVEAVIAKPFTLAEIRALVGQVLG